MRRDEVLCLVLGGGRGTRLDPLTRYRSKPAVPVGGKFRLVDIPISNSLNSGVRRIFVITQFNSASLNWHITRTYNFDLFGQGFVQLLAAEQTLSDNRWFQGTADAVRRCFVHMEELAPRDVLILSGDQLYRMDFGPMIRQHRETGATVTIAAKPMPKEETSGFGLMKLDGERRVKSFLEKPQDPSLLKGYELPESLFAGDDRADTYPASMGIYVFRYDALREMLDTTDDADFGKHVLPRAVAERDVRAFLFRGYWEDIGTMRAFYEANLALAASEPPFVFYTAGAPIYTAPRFLGGSRMEGCTVRESMICDGGFLYAKEITESVIGARAVINHNSVIRRSVLMGADGYEGDVPRQAGDPPLGIGRDCHIEGAIIDKNARIGDGVRITPKAPGTNEDHPFHFVRDGIVVIPKNYAVPPGVQI
ncbi:glucose-1-phosphate adenylyltransferase [bacterium]|nr:glucose-1-phosphate adenylyltransferase [bacterium]